MPADLPKPQGGSRFQLIRKVGVTPKFLATCTTVTFTRTNELERATVYDRNAPTAVPNSRSVKKERSWRLNFSGLADLEDLKLLEDDFDNEDSVPYQLKFDRPLAAGGGSYDGLVHYESLEIGKQENGLVKFSAQCMGDGDILWTDAAA